MKTALITGAASGIGLALSTSCLRKGDAAIMVDKDQAKLAQEANKLGQEFPNQVHAIPCDITNNHDVVALARQVEQEFDKLDWIFNNAGIIGNIAPAWELEEEQIHQVMNVNVYGMMNVIRAFIPLLFRQSFNSHIINIASLYALCSGSQLAPYSMSKHAVLALSESLYFDLKRFEKPVNISVVFPSFTDTSLLSHSNERSSSLHHSLNHLLSHSRPAEEVANHIISEVENNRFYILPDKEVKGYCEERVQAILAQEPPHLNNIEKLIGTLIKRQK
jgi:NAD(P)-dependent dehydrogenase (short-subunit alcohol dehydrogenase family)